MRMCRPWRQGALSAASAIETVQRLSTPGSEIYSAVALHYYMQYHLHVQLSDAAAHARRKAGRCRLRERERETRQRV